MGMSHAFPLPPDLPKPVDDGACRHLPGTRIPSIALRSTSGRMVNLATLNAPLIVLYCYPMTGVPGRPLPKDWDSIPGARGCTPQTCEFRDHHAELKSLGAEVFGLSTQRTKYQQEMVERLNVPFEVLSDSDFRLSDALRFPTFEVEGMRLIKRLTLIIRNGVIATVFYPVFPPNENAQQVIEWLKGQWMAGL
jgi:peroxiredoxin